MHTLIYTDYVFSRVQRQCNVNILYTPDRNAVAPFAGAMRCEHTGQEQIGGSGVDVQ